jgi:Brp/Blh family beta-carotene 15,15'-monooxygenase
VALTESIPGLRAAYARNVVRPSWLALGVVAAAFPLAPPLPPAVRYAPFVLSVVVLGLPHGAVDHLAPARLGLPRRRAFAVVGVGYAVGMAAYLGLWAVAPAPAFASFILLTWFHWGQGDVYALLDFAGAGHLPTRAERALTLLVRGAYPMVVPLVAFPEAYRRVAAAAVSLFGADAVVLAPAFTPGARLVAGGGVLAATLVSLGVGAWRVRRGAARGPWLVDVGENALLWAYFLVVPPILAVGLYFCLWHALRHVARLVGVDRPSATALAAGEWPTAARRFARDAAPLTALSLVLFAGLYLFVPRPPGDPTGLLALYLVGIAALTLPHVVVVTWMDRRQGVW